MAFIRVEHINLLGISAAVPEKKTVNDNPKFSATTGVFEKRVAEKNVCTSDLCYEAAQRLMQELSIDRSEIDILVFVSQTPDYKLPVTSTILQHKLGLPQSCLCFDIPLGCSGYVYGLGTIGSLMGSGKLRKGLLLVGDTISKTVAPGDQSTEPLFGDAGTATLLEYSDTAEPMLFGLGSDGEGYETIIIHGGAARGSDQAEHLVLNGMDVFEFGINKVPKVVNEFLSHFELERSTIDLFVFHQANKMMNDKIYKKLAIPQEKTITSLDVFGNTSSATIPLTLIHQRESIAAGSCLLFCGFGVGLSWGTCYIRTSKTIHLSPIIEI